MSFPFFFLNFSHNLKILFLNISHNFKILLKKNDFQLYTIKPNLTLMLLMLSLMLTPLSPLLLLLFLSFTLSKLQNITFLMPNSLSLFPPWSLHLLWITSSYLFNCHFAKKITSSYLFSVIFPPCLQVQITLWNLIDF